MTPLLTIGRTIGNGHGAGERGVAATPPPIRKVTMDALKGANLALRFLLELAALAALGYWGYQTGSGSFSRIALAIGAPLLAAVVWGLFVAPKATFATNGVLRLGLQVLVFGAAALALVNAGQETLAVALGSIAVVNAALMAVWNQ